MSTKFRPPRQQVMEIQCDTAQEATMVQALLDKHSIKGKMQGTFIVPYPAPPEFVKELEVLRDQTTDKPLDSKPTGIL